MAHSFAWSNTNADFQHLWVNIHHWKFVVEPSLQAEHALNMDFKFDGIAAIGPLKGLPVSASLQLRERNSPPDYLKAKWPEHSGDLQGFAEAGDRDGCGMALDLTLFCQPAAFDWIYRAFSAGLVPGGSLGYQVQLDCPAIQKPDFWVDHWLRERLRVKFWSVESTLSMDNSKS